MRRSALTVSAAETLARCAVPGNISASPWRCRPRSVQRVPAAWPGRRYADNERPPDPAWPRSIRSIAPRRRRNRPWVGRDHVAEPPDHRDARGVVGVNHRPTTVSATAPVLVLTAAARPPTSAVGQPDVDISTSRSTRSDACAATHGHHAQRQWQVPDLEPVSSARASAPGRPARTGRAAPVTAVPAVVVPDDPEPVASASCGSHMSRSHQRAGQQQRRCVSGPSRTQLTATAPILPPVPSPTGCQAAPGLCGAAGQLASRRRTGTPATG
jgi:hypothetical protein